jgi:hypothetical protein
MGPNRWSDKYDRWEEDMGGSRSQLNRRRVAPHPVVQCVISFADFLDAAIADFFNGTGACSQPAAAR